MTNYNYGAIQQDAHWAVHKGDHRRLNGQVNRIVICTACITWRFTRFFGFHVLYLVCSPVLLSCKNTCQISGHHTKANKSIQYTTRCTT